MQEKFQLNQCPIRQVVAKVSGKWSLLALHAIRAYQPVRFNDLQKAIPDVSTKMLSTTLRSLEADDLVQRTVYAEVPPRVEYRLTQRGASLMPLLDNLTQWGLDNLQPIMAHRKDFLHTSH